MSDSTQATIKPLRAWFEVILVALLIPIGGIIAGLTGFLPMSAIGSALLPVLVASILLRREGRSWRSVVFASRLSPLRLLVFTCAAVVGGYLLVALSSFAMQLLGFGSRDLSLIAEQLSGNLTLYLWFMIPVVWGSAAVGEEMLARGFLLHRIETVAGTTTAILLQAAIFALAHAYQGAVGVVSIFFLALLFGKLFVRSGRNLLPLILAHGVIDSVGITLIYLGYADLMK